MKGVNSSGIFFMIDTIKITLTLFVKFIKQSVTVYDTLQMPKKNKKNKSIIKMIKNLFMEETNFPKRR